MVEQQASEQGYIDSPYIIVQHQQNTTLSTVLSVLNSTRSADIPKVLSSLDAVSQDTLMKYLYKAMESIDEGTNCAVLLNWHEKVGLKFALAVRGLLSAQSTATAA